jgi:hypothetical protein
MGDADPRRILFSLSPRICLLICAIKDGNEKEQAGLVRQAQMANAAVRGPQVLEEMVEEMRKLRIVLERIAAREV